MNYKPLPQINNHDFNPQHRESSSDNETGNEGKEERLYKTKTAAKKAQKGLPKKEREVFDKDISQDDEREEILKPKKNKFDVIVIPRDISFAKERDLTKIIKADKRNNQDRKRLAKTEI